MWTYWRWTYIIFNTYVCRAEYNFPYWTPCNTYVWNRKFSFKWNISNHSCLFVQFTGESRELQEFLQIEKLALSETLKDSETEVEQLKEDFKSKDIQVKEVEERCMHLVRLGEQRYQELLTSQQQLKTFSDMAKDLMMNQVHVTKS